MVEGIAALITAAGYSSRMGDFKPLLTLGGTTALARAVNTFLAAGIEQIQVVVGYRAADLIPVLEEQRVTAVYNANFQQGMFSSVCTGIANLPSDAEAFFLLPADNPLVRPHTVQLLIQAWQESKSALIYPCFDGERGHPPLISTEYKNEILSCSKEDNLREILARHEAEALDVEVADRGILLDMDTQVDYRSLLKRAAAIEIPDQEECEAVLRLAGASTGVIKHGRAVAALACSLAKCLNRFGYNLQLELLTAAGLLHDVAKGRPDHASVGAALLRGMGFSGVAEIVACHMGDGLEADGGIGEKELIYLADKLMQGDQPVTLQERFGSSVKRFAAEPEVMQAVKVRRRRAQLIKQRVEKVLGIQLDKCLAEWPEKGLCRK